MKQPIAGVSSPEADETTVMILWPSIAMYPTGQWLGRVLSIRWPDLYIFRAGNLFALLLIPLALYLYLCRIAPKSGTRYRLSNQRLIVERGLQGEPQSWIGLADFDSVEIQVKPGQEWFPAGDLVFAKESREVFRLQGVSRPEPLRQTCLEVQQARQSVAEVRRRQTAVK